MSTTIEVSIPTELWLSANQRLHWAPKAKRTRALRAKGFVAARTNGLRDIGTAHIAAFIGYPRNAKADPSNAAPTVKALIDGMVDAGVWPDDDHVHVIGPTYLRGPKCETGEHMVRFVITPQEVPW